MSPAGGTFSILLLILLIFAVIIFCFCFQVTVPFKVKLKCVFYFQLDKKVYLNNTNKKLNVEIYSVSSVI